MKKLILLAMLPLCAAGTAAAQQAPQAAQSPQPETSRHEFSVYGKAGISTLRYKLNYGEQNAGFGGGLGVGYTWFFDKRFGLQTGLEVNFYRSKAKFDDGTQFQKLVFEDTNGDAVFTSTFVSEVSGFRERQRAAYLDIPLMVQYQTQGRHRFYAALGVKAGMRLSSKFETTADLHNSIVDNWGGEITVYDEQDESRFTGNYPGRSFSGDTELKFAALGAVEAGVKWRLNDGMRLYTGLYADIGLNDIRKNASDADILSYTDATEGPRTEEHPDGLVPAKYGLASVLSSKVRTQKVRPLAFGVKIGLAFGGRPKTMPAPVYVPPTPAVSADADSLRRVQEAAEAEKARLAAAEKARLAAEAQRERESAAAAAEKARAAEARAKAVDLLLEPLDEFGFDKWELTDEQRGRLSQKAAALLDYPGLLLILRGHTCDIGPSEYNRKLGERRAESVKRCLVEAGIPEERIATESRGKEQPLVPNTDRASRLHNRRVEFLVREKQ